VQLQLHRKDDGKSSKCDLCRTSAIMSAEAVPNETENDLGTYQIVYQPALRETVTKRHRERQSPNGIMRQLRQLLRDDDLAS